MVTPLRAHTREVAHLPLPPPPVLQPSSLRAAAAAAAAAAWFKCKHTRTAGAGIIDETAIIIMSAMAAAPSAAVDKKRDCIHPIMESGRERKSRVTPSDTLQGVLQDIEQGHIKQGLLLHDEHANSLGLLDAKGIVVSTNHEQVSSSVHYTETISDGLPDTKTISVPYRQRP